MKFREIIDNSENNKLVDFLNQALEEYPSGNFDIATAFFNIRAYEMIKDNLEGLTRFRLLLGKAPEIKSDRTLGDELTEIIRHEIEGFELSRDKETTVRSLIGFLGKDNVEIRIYDKEFLHGKAYIFDNLVVIGSSNFTSSGLTYNTELNSVHLEESKALYVRERWFEKFWAEAKDFKAELIQTLENSRYGTKEYSPYEVYIKSLYELQKEDLGAELDKDEQTGRPKTKVNLTEFQGDAISRVMTRLDKYGSILVADSVGLGKTWIAKKILEKIGYYDRGVVLIICPAQLRDMWRKECKSIDLPENMISQEELATEDFLKKAEKAVGGKNRLKDVNLIVVDESHNFRNPLSNRWENFFTLVHDNISRDGNNAKILFLTATPINNTIWDLYWQIMLLVSMNRRAFMKMGIPDLFQLFKSAEAKGDPSYLNDLLNEISIRRTRDYIQKNYPDAYILKDAPDGSQKEEKIKFPIRELQNIDYKLEDTYKGMYKEISNAITEKLTMAYYRILRYKKQEKRSPAEEMALGRMIALEGIFKTILLKRLESSVEAFRKSVSNHIKFLKNLKTYLEQGKLLTKKTIYKYILKQHEELVDITVELEKFKKGDFRIGELFSDIDSDIEILRQLLKKTSGIKPQDDAKLLCFKKRLLDLAKKGQVIVFTYYKDTLDYIYKNLQGTKEFRKLNLQDISGSTPPTSRSRIVDDFFNKEIDVLLSTDVLSEGMNLQAAQYLINYDLHWNPTRMIQRAGRIDRIGSPYSKIYVYNFFPEDELEELLKLVQILQNKIMNIDKSVGLDQTILGEEIHPKVFGIIRRIRQRDKTVLDELERDAFGGGERFYQPLKDYLKSKALEELENIPDGIHSGLANDKISGIFFYHKYGEDFHFWSLYNVNTEEILEHKTEILDYIACPPKKKRIIPDFFETVYGVNREIVDRIKSRFTEMESKIKTDSPLFELSWDRSSKFVITMLRDIDEKMSGYLVEFPEDKDVVGLFESVKDKLLSAPLTKKRLSQLRPIWKDLKDSRDWKSALESINEFLIDKGLSQLEEIGPFDPGKLKLIAIDFIS